MTDKKIVVVSTFVAEPIKEHLVELGKLDEIKYDVVFSQYNNIINELLDCIVW